jgi:hypothetical protein
MNMNGRRRLTWVTALTVASLLLGGSALNALAEGHGGGNGNHGSGGPGKSDQQQQQNPAVINQAKHDGESHPVQQASPAQTTATTNAEKHEDEGDNVQKQDVANNNTSNAQKHQDNENDNTNVQRHDDDNEDLVTPPARVTDEDRPGLGCGDDNHTHTGAPGNPDKTCKTGAGGDDQGLSTDDAASAAIAVAGATAVGDTGDGE